MIINKLLHQVGTSRHEHTRLLPYTHSRRAEGIEEEKRYSSTHSRPRHEMDVSGQLHATGAVPRFALNRPQKLSGLLKKQPHFSLHPFIPIQVKQTDVYTAYKQFTDTPADGCCL